MNKKIASSDDLSPAARRPLVDECMRQDLVAFIRRTFETVVPGESLHLNWHIRAMANALEQVRSGLIKRLIITVPPRHLKLITTSVAFPAYVLGHDPSKKFVCVSYSNELSIKHANDCRTVMKSAWYRGIFPRTRISPDKDTETEMLTTMRGGRLATSVGGTLTGRGGNIIILDDPMNPKQAMSEASRTSTIQWFRTTLLSRLNLKGEDAIIIVMQRLHVDDLVGILLEEGGWDHLDIPAIADGPQKIPMGLKTFYRRYEGDVLDTIREPMDVLMSMKASMGTMDFSAQYLQRPIPAEGNLIKREWLKYYQVPPERQPKDMIVISWDTAMKSTELADYSVGTVWHVQGNKFFLLDLIRRHYDYPELKRAVLNAKSRWPGGHMLVEDKGSGTSLIQDLRRDGVPVISIKPEGDKVSRLFANQAQFESGSVWFPQDADWMPDLVSELMAFPSVRHDDQVDSISQALTRIDGKLRGWRKIPMVPATLVRIRSPIREALEPDYYYPPDGKW
jgi:predicted phage terminase large subunit-like protein